MISTLRAAAARAPMVRAFSSVMPESLQMTNSMRFDEPTMEKHISPETYSAYKACMESGEALEKAHADEVAGAMQVRPPAACPPPPPFFHARRRDVPLRVARSVLLRRTR